MNNDVVMIQLDKPRELRYGHKALKTLVALTGKSLEAIETEGFDDLELVEKMVYCGLMTDAKNNNETLEMDKMEDLLDRAPSYAHIIKSIQAAFRAAFGAPPVDEGNGETPTE